MSDANYQEAWEKLKQRYSKKILIITNEIQLFLDQPAIKEPNDALAIRGLYDTSDEVVRAIKSLKTEGRDPWLVHIALQKLDNDTKRLWAHENGDKDYNWQSFLAFLEKHCVTLESCQQSSSRRYHSTKPSSSQGSIYRPAISKTFATQPDKCKLGCTESHGIYHCPKFLSSTIDEQIQYVKKLNLCLNCLRESHSVNVCRSRSCKYCNKRHSSLLCFSQKHILSSNPTQSVNNNLPVSAVKEDNSNPITATSTFSTRAHVLLSTAVVLVYDSQGSPHAHRALLDSASQSNFATKSLITKLGLSTNDITFSIQGIGQFSQPITKKSDIIVRSRAITFDNNIEFLIIDH